MGQERMLLLLVTVIFVAIGITVGFYLFGSSARTANREMIVEGINILASNALHFRERPPMLGGGGGHYAGYYIPQKLASTDDGVYTANVFQNSIVFVGSSKHGYGTVQATLDSSGTLAGFAFTGDFQ